MKISTATAFVIGALGVAAGCAWDDMTESDDGSAAIRELERRIVGPAKAYPADRYTEADAEKYARSKKLRRELGWHPSTEFERGLEQTICWYLENRAWWEPLRENVYRGERLGLMEASR